MEDTSIDTTQQVAVPEAAPVEQVVDSNNGVSGDVSAFDAPPEDTPPELDIEGILSRVPEQYREDPKAMAAWVRKSANKEFHRLHSQLNNRLRQAEELTRQAEDALKALAAQQAPRKRPTTVVNGEERELTDEEIYVRQLAYREQMTLMASAISKEYLALGYTQDDFKSVEPSTAREVVTFVQKGLSPKQALMAAGILPKPRASKPVVKEPPPDRARPVTGSAPKTKKQALADIWRDFK